MGKLLSRNAAIAYLRESCGSMSMKVFMNEVHAGRIPAKPYGKNYRYRQEDLDLWQNITKHLSEYSNAEKSGTRISRSSRMDAELSFDNLLVALKKTQQKNTARTGCSK